MSKTNKPSPLEIVELYHKRYLEYENAFNKDPFNEQDLQKQLKEVVKSDMDLDSDEFLNKMLDIIIEKPQKRSDVNNAAFKFAMFTDFYLLTQEEELPENVMKDYESLPIKENIKTYFSIKEGEFVKNEKEEVTNEMKTFFKNIVNQIKSQQ